MLHYRNKKHFMYKCRNYSILIRISCACSILPSCLERNWRSKNLPSKNSRHSRRPFIRNSKVPEETNDYIDFRLRLRSSRSFCLLRSCGYSLEIYEMSNFSVCVLDFLQRFLPISVQYLAFPQNTVADRIMLSLNNCIW